MTAPSPGPSVAVTSAAAGPASNAGNALLCDEYALTMAQSFLLHGQTGRVSFELFVRSLPAERGYLVAAGLEQAVEHLERLHVGGQDIEFLRARLRLRPEFLEHLAGLRFGGDVDAIPEGTVVGAETPLLRVTAARIEATLVEAALLAIINHQTLIASKAARIVDAARGRPVWDFSLRRVQGPEAGCGVARAAYLAGCAGTATVEAGRRHGIPTTGTMAHHFVLAFGPDREQAAFEQFLRDFPDRAVLLVDTFDTRRGVERAIAASQSTGVRLGGLRLDSGDIDGHSREARARLDAAGMGDARLLASGDLDEHSIDALLAAGAPLDAFGVGTMLGTSADAPALGGVYKLVEQECGDEMRPVMKLSEDKSSDPGAHQVFRRGCVDTLGLHREGLPGEPLLAPVLRDGRRVAELPSLADGRRRWTAQRDLIPPEVRRLRQPSPWVVRRSRKLIALRAMLAPPPVEAA